MLPSLNALATGYAFTGDTKIGDFTRDALMAIIEHGLADVPAVAYGASTKGWRHGPGHDKSKFAQMLSWVYDFCYDRFDERQQSRVADYAKECMSLAAQWRDFDAAQNANNRGARGLLTGPILSLAFEGDTEFEDIETCFLNGRVAMEKFLFLSYDSSGAPYEGPGYASGLAFITFVAEALRRRGVPNLLTNNRFERLPEYLMYELLPGGGRVNNLNDAHEECGSVVASLPLMGTSRGRLLSWLATQLDLHPVRLKKWLADDRVAIDHHHGEDSLFSFVVEGGFRHRKPAKSGLSHFTLFSDT